MHVPFAVFADAANISQEGKLNILGVFDAINVTTLPAVHPRACFVIRVKATATDVGRHLVTFQWTSPSGDELWSSSGELNVEAAPSTLDADLPVIAVVDLPLDAMGQYVMRVLVGSVLCAEASVRVTTAVQPTLGARPQLVS